MLRRLSLGLLASAISFASLPAIAQEYGSADDLGVSILSSVQIGFMSHSSMTPLITELVDVITKTGINNNV